MATWISTERRSFLGSTVHAVIQDLIPFWNGIYGKPIVTAIIYYYNLLKMSKQINFVNCGAFELWCWRRLLRVPWTTRRSNQSILKEISTEYSLEGLMLKLKLQKFGHLMWNTDSLEKILMKNLKRLKAGREGDNRGQDGWMATPTWWTWVWASSGSCWWTGRPGMLQSMGPQRVGHGWATELKQTKNYTQSWHTSVSAKWAPLHKRVENPACFNSSTR